MILLTLVSLSPMNRYKLGLASPNGTAAAVVAKHRHRIVHWVSFGGLTFLLALLGRNSKQRLLAFGTAAALGLLIECLQHVIYSNPLETWDIRDDVGASFIGLIFALMVLGAKIALGTNR